MALKGKLLESFLSLGKGTPPGTVSDPGRCPVVPQTDAPVSELVTYRGNHFNRIFLILVTTFVLVGALLFIIDSDHHAQTSTLLAGLRDSSITASKMTAFSEMAEVSRRRSELNARLIQVADAFEKDEITQELNALASQYAKLDMSVRKLPLSETEWMVLSRMAEQVAVMRPMQREVVERLMHGSFLEREQARRRIEREILPKQNELNRSLLELIRRSESQVVRMEEELRSAIAREAVLDDRLLALMVVFGILVMMLIAIKARWIQKHMDSTHLRLEVEIQRRTEQLAVERDRAQSASRAKSDFLANMSHEIRTPMNAIIGLSDLVLKTHMDHTQRDWVGKIHRSATSLLELLNDILDLSQVEANMLRLECIPFWLDEVICKVSDVVEVRAREKGLNFSVNLDRQVPIGLAGDPLRLRQILLNLINNAVKFTESGEVSLRVEEMERRNEMSTLRFTVRDSGIGMSRETLDRLFQPFTQADMSTSRKYGGSGLGLSIARRLVELMDGDIWAESEVGRGSCFMVELPMRRCAIGASDRKPKIRTRDFDLGGHRVLLVEDDEINQEIATLLLREQGLLVEVAGCGEEALELLERKPFDCVLMDLQMPGMDGFEVTRRIRDQQRFLDLPIIAMTANAMEEDRLRALDAGMDDHVGKPFHVQDLLSAIDAHLHRCGVKRTTDPARPVALDRGQSPNTT